ncbi:MAG: 2OG-Fe(II) oxygenase [Ilumatobacteraceae bacterium]
MSGAQPVPHLVIEDFLADADHERLLELVANSTTFTPAHVDLPTGAVGAIDDTVRRAGVATPGALIDELFAAKLRALLPHVRREVGVGHFRLGDLEWQLTAHGNGDFFTAHHDLGHAWQRSSGRRVSFVYYFHAHPRTFEGGELRLYDRVGDPSTAADRTASFQVVEPNANSIVFFPSDALHEVTPVEVPGDPSEPGATRFTLTGWFHDADHRIAAPPMDRATRTALAERYVPSFTATGFEVVPTPPPVHRALLALYTDRFDSRGSERPDIEYMPTGTPDFIDITDVKDQFSLALQAIHEEWSGCELVPSAVYGLRVYRSGQTLLPHTDTLETHVISSIVHIGHDTEEPWPLWLKDLHGNEHDIVLEPGEMLLYESARCPHGRVVPLRGAAYCSLFVHYRPVDWNVDHWLLIDRAIAAGDLDLIRDEWLPRSGIDPQR